MTEDPNKRIASIVENAPTLSGMAPASPSAAPDLEDSFEDQTEIPENTDWSVVRQCAAEPQNDIGNSRRLRIRCGNDILHVQNIGWHVYDGRRWLEDIDDCGTRPMCHMVVEAIALESYVLEPTAREREVLEAAEAARERTAEIYRERNELDDNGDITKAERDRRKRDLSEEAARLKTAIERGQMAAKALQSRQTQRRRFANTSGNSGKIDGMLREAAAYLSRPVRDLDADPLAFNVDNGTVRFVQVDEPDLENPDPNPEVERLIKVWKVKLSEHDRSDMISKLGPVAYDKDAGCPIFDAFIARILPSVAVREYLQRFFGYSLTALTKEQVFMLFHGEGANGKSTLVDVISRICGDYATSVPIATLVGEDRRKGAEATPDLVRLPGARLVRSAEPKEGVSFDESLIKQLTSGEPILVRRLNEEFVEVYPTFKLVISMNRKPPIKGNDDGIWRRVSLVPFDVQIPKAERDKELPEKLWEERSGILNWLIAGALDYFARGHLDPPDEVLAATQEYRDESDLMGAFVRAALDVTKQPHDSENTGDLYAAFVEYCKKAALTPWAANTFTRRLPKTASQFGFEKGKSSISVYTGVRVRPEFQPSSHTF
jgi:putative DNA primase/helicase